MNNKVTLDEVLLAVRELTFDRFVIPAIAIKAIAGATVSIVPAEESPVESDPFSYGYIEIKNSTTSLFKESFKDHTSIDSLMNKLINAEIVVAYTPYYKGDEPCSSLLKVTDKSLETDLTLFRRYFFSDNEVLKTIATYYHKVLSFPIMDTTEINDELMGKLIRPSEKHLVLWVSYMLVDKRRMYEQAASAIGQHYTDGSDYVGAIADSNPNNTTVQIGSVFTIQENIAEGYFSENFNGVGSDNVWGDRYSFWYRLQLYIRGLLEECFGDYSLRKNTVMSGHIDLVRELDFRSYYDSFPFTLSPLSRGILTKVPG